MHDMRSLLLITMEIVLIFKVNIIKNLFRLNYNLFEQNRYRPPYVLLLRLLFRNKKEIKAFDRSYVLRSVISCLNVKKSWISLIHIAYICETFSVNVIFYNSTKSMIYLLLVRLYQCRCQHWISEALTLPDCLPWYLHCFRFGLNISIRNFPVKYTFSFVLWKTVHDVYRLGIAKEYTAPFPNMLFRRIK